MAVDGIWALALDTPGEKVRANLELISDGTVLTGTYDGAAISNAKTDGVNVSFDAQITTPFKLKFKCSGVVDGDEITGRAKAAMMTVDFSGNRVE